MDIQHKKLASGQWEKMSFVEQMANVGSEVERTIKWKEKDNADYSQKAFERALELLDLTIADVKNKNKLKELTRTRESLADFFIFENEYKSTNEIWQKYFLAFGVAARSNR